jgi:histidyl-tRNA synthetase
MPSHARATARRWLRIWRSMKQTFRLHKNPLRILDSKDAGDRSIIANAPTLSAFFNEASAQHFARVKAGLEALGIAYKVSDTLVRGLDYYSHTVFEITTDQLGAQGTVLAGGRYDGLVKLMGGPEVAGIGFAAGIERLVALMAAPVVPSAPTVTVIPMSEAQEVAAWALAQDLRTAGIATDIAYRGNAKKRFERANKVAAKFAAILGEDEVNNGQVMLKNLTTGEQRSIQQSALAAVLATGD